jgi:hypothetical protein
MPEMLISVLTLKEDRGVSEQVLNRTFEPNKQEAAVDWRKLLKRGVIVCTPYQQ